MSAEARRTTTLSEFESKRRLAAAGIPIVAERLAADPEQAAAAAAELGFPVAVKLCGRAIAHKTERGLVRLGMGNAGGARAAAAELLAQARPEDGDVQVLVSRMVSGKRELIAGMVDDPTFGRCVMLGIGGIFAELLRDVAFRLAPLSRGDAADMVDDLALASDDPAIVAIDVNPLIVCDGVPIAVDALVEVAER